MTDDNIHQLPRLGLGDAIRLFGMTARAIRFYEERGLVEARRDRLNHRYFDAANRKRLSWICQLRHAGLSLPDIQAVLDAEEAGGDGQPCALEKLRSRRITLEAQLRHIESATEALQNLAPSRRRALAAQC